MTVIVGGQRTNGVPNPPESMEPIVRRWAMELVDSLRKLSNQNLQTIEDVQGVRDDLESLPPGGGTVDEQAIIDEVMEATSRLFADLSEYNRRAFDWAQRTATEGIESLARGHIDRGFNRTAIISEQQVRRTETLALSQQYTSLNATLGTTNANVTSLQTAMASAEDDIQALAQDVTTVQTSVAGNTASISSLMSSVDGIEARWGVSTTIQGYVNGLVQLDGTASGSTFTVIADRMQFAQPGVSGGDPVSLLTIGNVNGVPAIGIRAAMLIDGSVVARHISVSSLSAISANFGTATFSGVAKGTNDKLIIDFNAPRIRMVA